MSKFDKAREVEQIVWYMRLSDFPRAGNRALIDNLFNGFPPYQPEEWARMAATNATNVNFLEGTKIASDARMQFSNAFLKPGNFFTVQLTSGEKTHRQDWSNIITEEINRVMKRSLKYRECLRNVFAQVVLHGVGPVIWPDQEKWVPSMQMMGDVLIPSQTLLTMENLNYFAVYRRYTPGELWRMTHGPQIDPGWDVEMAEECCKWAYMQWGQTNATYDSIWNPERWAENLKEYSQFWSSDAVPTVNCYDFYYLHEEGRDWGWRRKIVLDTPDFNPKSKKVGTSNILDQKDSKFLYDSNKKRNKNYASKLENIVHFQFADGSVIAPFRYHSVRSLGFLLYSVCHLQNRIRCKLNDAAMEGMMNYLQGLNPDDGERASKIDLIDKGILPDGVRFVPQNERWNINAPLAQLVIGLNRQNMADNSASFTQNFGENAEQGPEKTATEIAAQVNAANALVGSMLQTAYGYQEAQYVEICRRFSRPNSRDMGVKEFRGACLKRGVPVELLDSTLWNVSVTKVMGHGSKQVEMAQAQGLMMMYDRFDPDSQRIILKQAAFAHTDDEALADLLVPIQQNQATQSVHDAQVSAPMLLMGLPMALKQGVSHAEYAASLLAAMGAKIGFIEQRGAMATQEEIAGLQNIAGETVEGQFVEGNGAAAHIAILEQAKENASLVKELRDVLGKNLNYVRGYVQRLQEQQEQQQPQMDAESQAKILALQTTAESKARIAEASAAQKRDHRQQQFEQKISQDQQRSELDAAKQIRQAQVDEAKQDLLTASQIRNQNAQAEAQKENADSAEAKSA